MAAEGARAETGSAHEEADRALEALAARSAELEQREAALKDREKEVSSRERRLRRAAEGTVAALHGDEPAEKQKAAEPAPELTFSEGIQALAKARRRQGAAKPR